MEMHFKKGQEIEVSSIEEGFDGSWYTATIIGSARKKKKTPTYTIEYHTLADESETQKLRETVDASQIRPRPPVEKEVRLYKLYEEVDAYVNDGWWQGVVTKVLEGNRYIVYFIGTKDEMEFGQSDLRTHLEWIQGVWVRPQNMGKKEPIEVTFDQENCRDTWFPAIVLEEINNDSFLVEYKTLTGQLKNIVDSRHIRPSPPNDSPCKSFDRLQKVDAFYDFMWSSGVITEILAEDRYIVFVNRQNIHIEFNQSELRPHMEWINDKWLRESAETSVIQNSQGGVESLILTGGTTIRTDTANPPSSCAVKDSLNDSSPGSSQQMITPLPTCNPVLKIKLTASQNSDEASQPYKKLKKGVATKSPHPMKACHVRETSSRNSTGAEPQDNVTTPTPKGKSSRKSHRESLRGPVSLITDVNEGDGLSDSHLEKAKDDVQNEEASSREITDTIVPTECAEPVDHITGDPLPSSSPRDRPNAIGKEDEQSGQGRPRGLTSILSSERDWPQGTHSSRTKSVTESAELVNNETEDHMPLPLHCEFTFPMGQNSGVSPEEQFIPNKATAEGDEPMETLEPESSIAFVEDIILDDCKGARGDVQNERALTSIVIDVTRQGDEGSLTQSLPLECVGSLNHNAEKDSLIPKFDCPPTERCTGISPENQIMQSEAIHREDPSDMFELQNPLLSIECTSNLGERTFLAENNNTKGNEQDGRALKSDATTSAFSSSPIQACDGAVPRNLPFVRSSPLWAMWETIDSSNSFNSVPQQPHFHQLEQYNEELREGMALGYMACLANVLEKTRIITLEQPQSSFEEKIAALDDLKELGFTVRPIRSKLEELLKIKENNGQLEDASKEVRNQIIKEKHKTDRIEVQIDEIQKTIIEINKRLQSVMEEKERRVSNMAQLEKNKEEARQSLQAVRHDFDRLVAAPW